jgi:hypothetical protein
MGTPACAGSATRISGHERLRASRRSAKVSNRQAGALSRPRRTSPLSLLAAVAAIGFVAKRKRMRAWRPLLPWTISSRLGCR